MHRWPDAAAVAAAVRALAESLVDDHSIRKVGYIGSYARGDWGVGSDLDLVVVTREGTERPVVKTDRIPVPVDLLLYSETELERILEAGGRFAKVLRTEAVWVLSR